MEEARIKYIIEWLDWEKLTEWEEGFVESVEQYFVARGDLTPKQESLLERIYKEKTR